MRGARGAHTPAGKDAAKVIMMIVCEGEGLLDPVADDETA